MPETSGLINVKYHIPSSVTGRDKDLEHYFLGNPRTLTLIAIIVLKNTDPFSCVRQFQYYLIAIKIITVKCHCCEVHITLGERWDGGMNVSCHSLHFCLMDHHT